MGRMSEEVALRPLREDDLAVLDRFDADPTVLGPFQWKGFTDPRARRRRWDKDGYVNVASTGLAVTVKAEIAGIASWKAADRGGPAGGCLEIGLTLLPEFRGRGLGDAAHRMLVDHVFRTTRVHRLEAFTDAENAAARRILEKLGFHREGVMCQVTWRDGGWRDEAVYALLRPDHHGHKH